MKSIHAQNIILMSMFFPWLFQLHEICNLVKETPDDCGIFKHPFGCPWWFRREESFGPDRTLGFKQHMNKPIHVYKHTLNLNSNYSQNEQSYSKFTKCQSLFFWPCLSDMWSYNEETSFPGHDCFMQEATINRHGWFPWQPHYSYLFFINVFSKPTFFTVTRTWKIVVWHILWVSLICKGICFCSEIKDRFN